MNSPKFMSEDINANPNVVRGVNRWLSKGNHGDKRPDDHKGQGCLLETPEACGSKETSYGWWNVPRNSTAGIDD